MRTGTMQSSVLTSDEEKGGWDIDPGALLGSWGETVKKHDAWDQDDPLSTIQALGKTQQNFYVYNINTEAQWNCLPELLKAAHGTKIKIFAAMNSPRQNSDLNRWFATAPGDFPAVTNDEAQWIADRDYMLVWLDAWVEAAKALSNLSLKHKDNLAGFVINDFMTCVESADYPKGMDGTQLSKSDIQLIYDACHSLNPQFGFYPVLTFPDLGRFICRGLILGGNYGVRMQSGESMVVEYEVPLLPDPVRSRLTFFQHSASTTDGVYRSVRVNGVPVWKIPLNNSRRPEVDYTSLALPLHSGHNRIEIRIDSEAFTTGCSVNLWYVWDIKLQYWMAGSKGPIDVDLRPRFETTASSALYYANPGCMGELFNEFPKDASGNVELHNDDYRCVHKGVFGVPHLPDDPIKGRMARRLICAPNDSYLLVKGVIDGILPYVTDTTVYGESDALDPSRQFDRLLGDTRAELGNALLIPLNTAMTNVPINPDVLVHRLRVSAEVTGVAGVYRFPLGMCFMDVLDQRGIFAPYHRGQLILQWPSDQDPVPGWFQEWVHVPPPTGSVKMTVDIHDDSDADPDSLGNLLKTVKGGGLASPYEVDPLADGQDPVTVPLDGSLLSSRVSDPVRIGLSSSGSVPNTKVYAVAHDSTGITEIPASEWKFKSGVTDPNTLAIYHRVIDFFARVRSP